MVTIFSSRSESILQSLRRFWTYKELFYYLVWRDIKVRYKQTIVGVGWAVLQPFLMMLVFTLIFGASGKMTTGEVPYPIFVYIGLLFWNLFEKAITSASESVIANRNLVKSASFPKIILPLSSVVVNLVDFIVGFGLLILLMAVYRLTPHSLSLIILPLGIILITMLSVGVGALLAIINTTYRDVRFLIPFGLKILLFLTPIIYSESFVGEKYRTILNVNPLTGIIGAVRASLFDPGAMKSGILIAAVCLSVIFFMIGIGYFSRKEDDYIDIL